MWKRLLCALLCITNPLQSYAKTIRNIEIEENSIPTIRTAIGYSTVLDFPSKPQSAVLGDQDAFKLEYIGTSITLKPLFSGAKSNLFVFSDQYRYQFTIIAGNASQVDYLVKLRLKQSQLNPSPEPKRKQKNLRLAKYFHGYTFKVTRATQAGTELLLEFEVSSKKHDYDFSPTSFGVKRKGVFESIEHLYLDDLKIGPKLPSVKGQLVLLETSFRDLPNLSLIFAVPSKNKTVRLLLPLFQKAG